MSLIEVVCDPVWEPLTGWPLPIEITDHTFRPLWRGILHICIPFKVVDLVDGRYSVRIAMPSGEVFTEVVDIVDQRPERVMFPIHLPDEAKGAEWAYFLNRLTHPWTVGETPELTPWIRIWQLRSEKWEVERVQGPVKTRGAGALEIDLRLPRNQHSFQVGGEELVWRNYSLPPGEHVKTLLMSMEGGIRFAAICPSESAAEVLLSFMRSGAWRDAALLAEEVQRRLLEESASEYRSAVSPLVLAYYYLMLGDPDRIGALMPLMKGWDLPDVLVLASWQMLYDDRCDWDLIRRQLLMASVRRPPIYREGLVLLRDALKLLQYHFGDDDDQLNAARHRTGHFMLSLDGEYALTAYAGRNPWNPAEDGPTGVPEPKSVLRFPGREGEYFPTTAEGQHSSQSLDLDGLLRAGAHFGHQRRNWNPKMKPFIFGERQKMHIIDLQQTLRAAQTAAAVVQRVSSEGGQVLFVGTKPQASGIVQEEAERCRSPYVTKRWLGGLLTNFATIKKSMARLRELDAQVEEGGYYRTSKKEEARQRRLHQKLDASIGGIRRLERLPDLLYVVDAKLEKTALSEARKLGIPTVALADTDADPDLIDYVIPANDEAHRSIRLLTRTVADAILTGAPDRG